MKRKIDVLVIGGGVIGICSAYYLTQHGRGVTVVEKGEVCSGSSYGNAGLIAPSHSIPLAKPGVVSQGLRWLFNPESPFYVKPRLSTDLISWLWKFYRAANDNRQMYSGMKAIYEFTSESLKLYRELAALPGIDFGFEQRGLLIACKTEKGLEAAVKEYKQMQEFGFEAHILDPGGLLNLNLGVRTDVIGGIYFPEDAHIIPHQFVGELARHAVKNGAELLTSTRVLGFETSGRRITSVRTTKGDFEPEETVLAGGSWSPDIVRDLKIKLLIQPAKGYSITINQPENLPSLPVLLSEAKVIVTPMRETLRFGGTLELTGLDQSINYRRVQAIIKSVPEYLPDLAITQHAQPEIWSGLRPCSPDGLPLLGRPRTYDNLIIATGHGMKGMAMGPVTGVLVSQMARKESPSFDLGLVDIDRFH